MRYRVWLKATIEDAILIDAGSVSEANAKVQRAIDDGTVADLAFDSIQQIHGQDYELLTNETRQFD